MSPTLAQAPIPTHAINPTTARSLEKRLQLQFQSRRQAQPQQKQAQNQHKSNPNLGHNPKPIQPTPIPKPTQILTPTLAPIPATIQPYPPQKKSQISDQNPRTGKSGRGECADQTNFEKTFPLSTQTKSSLILLLGPNYKMLSLAQKKNC